MKGMYFLLPILFTIFISFRVVRAASVVRLMPGLIPAMITTDSSLIGSAIASYRSCCEKILVPGIERGK